MGDQDITDDSHHVYKTVPSTILTTSQKIFNSLNLCNLWDSTINIFIPTDEEAKSTKKSLKIYPTLYS